MKRGNFLIKTTFLLLLLIPGTMLAAQTIARLTVHAGTYNRQHTPVSKNTDWVLNPGNDYTLIYRMLDYESEITRETAEAAWIDFAFPPEVTIQR